MLMWLALVTGAAQPQLADRLHRVQEVYRQGGAMSATFTQVYRDALRPQASQRAERGQFFIDKIGRVRLSYLSPERKEFVFDGTTAYFYQPQEAQVTVFPSFEDSLVAASMQVLWGHGDLDRLHTVEACLPAAAAAKLSAGPQPAPSSAPTAIPAAELCVQLRPKVHDPQMAWVRLGLDESKRRLNRFVIIDSMGNSTEYAFEQVRLNQNLDPALFRFTIPKDATVLDASSGS